MGHGSLKYISYENFNCASENITLGRCTLIIIFKLRYFFCRLNWSLLFYIYIYSYLGDSEFFWWRKIIIMHAKGSMRLSSFLTPIPKNHLRNYSTIYGWNHPGSTSLLGRSENQNSQKINNAECFFCVLVYKEQGKLQLV